MPDIAKGDCFPVGWISYEDDYKKFQRTVTRPPNRHVPNPADIQMIDRFRREFMKWNPASLADFRLHAEKIGGNLTVSKVLMQQYFGNNPIVVLAAHNEISAVVASMYEQNKFVDLKKQP